VMSFTPDEVQRQTMRFTGCDEFHCKPDERDHRVENDTDRPLNEVSWTILNLMRGVEDMHH